MSADWKTDRAIDFVMEDSRITSMSLPSKLSEWQCHLTEGPYGLTLSVAEGKEPIWFHRKMQELCLGFKWRKSNAR